jgi:hypothetical protein
MASLKSFLPVMASALATTPDALYSRQRALVRLGLLPTKEGKGPGSGVLLNSDALAVMLIAVLAADTLAETDERVVRLCNAEASNFEFDETRTIFADARTFKDAVSAAIADGNNPKGYFVKTLRVSQTRGQLVVVESTGKKRRMLTKTYDVDHDDGRSSSPLIKTTELNFFGEVSVMLLLMGFAKATGQPFFEKED